MMNNRNNKTKLINMSCNLFLHPINYGNSVQFNVNYRLIGLKQKLKQCELKERMDEKFI